MARRMNSLPMSGDELRVFPDPAQMIQGARQSLSERHIRDVLDQLAGTGTMVQMRQPSGVRIAISLTRKA